MSASDASGAPESSERPTTPSDPVAAQDSTLGLAGGPLLVLPVIDWRFGLACLSTISKDMRGRLLIVDNALHSHRRAVTLSRFYERPEWNLGIARTFNRGVALAQEHGYDSVVWVSCTMRFTDGGASILDLAHAARGGVALTHRFHWHCVAVSMEAIERVGVMDENYYPAHVEDTDWRRRWNLAGGETRFLPDEAIKAECEKDGHGYDALKAESHGEPFLNLDALNAYYESKWSGPYHPQEKGGQEQFDRPFGKDVGLDWWPEAPAIPELAARYGITVRRRR